MTANPFGELELLRCRGAGEDAARCERIETREKWRRVPAEQGTVRHHVVDVAATSRIVRVRAFRPGAHERIAADATPRSHG